MAKGFAPSSRIWILALCIVCGYGAIGYRLVQLHVLDAPQLVQEIQDNRYRLITINPKRGDIYDANNELLATNQTFMEVGVDPALIKYEDLRKLPTLAKLLGMDLRDVERAFGAERGRFVDFEGNQRVRWRKLRRDVTELAYEEIKKLNMRCVYGNRHYDRVYPKNSIASHLVGYVRQDGQAVAGLEKELDFYLKGQKGWKESEVKSGKEMAQFRRREVPARNGFDVELTIDSFVQHTIEEELAEIAEKMNPQTASIIVSNPFTGEILGLANYPTFDPNYYNEAKLIPLENRDPIDPKNNRALTDPIEPGSTFKIMAASAAIEEGLVSEQTQFDCGQDTIVTPSGYRARLPKDSHRNGVMTVEQIVAKSSNRGAAHLAVLLGEREFYDYVKEFGFGERSGLSIGVESRGILNPVEKWDGLTITRMPMGHAIGATPIQIHYAMATIANGGVLMQPKTVARLRDVDGNVAMEFGEIAKRRVVTKGTAERIAALLEKTVSPQGTANIASVQGYRVAGKTGTSQKIINGRYSSLEHVGSFSGFFPADEAFRPGPIENKKCLVITVIVDGAEVPGVAYGGKVAGPSFKKIAQKLIPYYAITPSDTERAFAIRDNRNNFNVR
ncbi:MAG: penicillin-binding protein 2 [Verrucomicrobiota bacterium]